VTSRSIVVPNPNTLYYAAVVACSDASCTQYAGHNVVKAVKTQPPVAPFNGLNNVELPPGLEGLSVLNLNWNLPNTALGDYNEIRIFLTDSNGFYNASLDELPVWNPADPNVIGL